MRIGYLNGYYEDGKVYRFGAVKVVREEILVIRGNYTYKAFKSIF